ncbi:hypothetical protein BJ912DRAFT_926835 [Pholiota molesta]|nr:hypothetical protein BJ912DRAFT_926835 [Pholiota molesta]
MILNNLKVFLVVISAIGLAAAQAQCNNDNDCPGSEFGEGGEATLCIPQNQCVNQSLSNTELMLRILQWKDDRRNLRRWLIALRSFKLDVAADMEGKHENRRSIVYNTV